MIANSEQWVGQIVDGKFRLDRSLGGADRTAVFLIEKTPDSPSPRLIRLLESTSEGAAEQYARWQSSSRLSHPHLIQILETGRSEIGGQDVFYVVSEYGEENLAQIIPERALSADEAGQVLAAVLDALTYIHGQGLVHGRLKPSNIFAIGDTIKVSSDTLCPAGGPPAQGPAGYPYAAPESRVEPLTSSADVWSLGVTLSEVLTQHRLSIDWPREQLTLPAGIPEPFREIVANCLQIDPAKRWTIRQIQERLSTERSLELRTKAPSSASLQSGPSKNWIYAAVVALFILGFIFIPRLKPPLPSGSTAEAPQPSAPQSSVDSAAASTPSAAVAGQECCDGKVVERRTPRVSTGALHTIQGKIRVVVDLHVDEQGAVTSAQLKSPGPSRYFSERALEAGRGWKFKAPEENGKPIASLWRVKFTFSHSAVNDSAEQVKP